MTPRPLVLLVDGLAQPMSPRDPAAWAASTSRLFPACDVAVARLGSARAFRRFSAGREVLA